MSSSASFAEFQARLITYSGLLFVFVLQRALSALPIHG
jgi:hypothetical protein